ncbi:MAG: class II aldolase/adducin family protein [Leptolyngbyaceae bacterium]|nr:class II aldolase/adducin family protein [Leptolyngbyaceae bacterium]
MQDEGVIKFSCTWESAQLVDFPALGELITWRDRMFAAGFIGTYPDGIGYGNISLRLKGHTFVISGTQTGHLDRTDASHYTLVDHWDIEQNTLHCTGPLKASSESLTHAALYAFSPAIQAVIHIHHRGLWQTHQGQLPTTRVTVPYGTPAMAHEMWRLFHEADLHHQHILVMAGHEEGLLAFDETLEAAAQRLLSLPLEG